MTYLLIAVGCFLLVVFIIFLKSRSNGENIDTAIINEASQKETGLAVFEVQFSKNEDEASSPTKSALAAESMFAALHGLLKEKTVNQEHLSFEIVSSISEGIRFYYTCPIEISKFVESQVYAQYPSAHIKAVPDYADKFRKTSKVYEIATIDFSRPYYYPIKSFRDFEIDTLSALTSAIGQVNEDEEIWYQFIVRPVADVWQKDGYSYVQKVRESGGMSSKSGSVFGDFTRIISREFTEILSGLATGVFIYKERVEPPRSSNIQVKIALSTETELRAIENKLSHMGFETNVRVMSAGPDHDRVETNLRTSLAVLKQYSSTSNNSFVADKVSNKSHYLNMMCNRGIDEDKILLLTTEELATFFSLSLRGY
ncbi:MAG: hypothetical protein KatS3mg101_0458 [Patescibacteria group bacterium]|nr:MAG: hypothetical protein KatS3mg101_0458 [Patescibacteria group bacterium]